MPPSRLGSGLGHGRLVRCIDGRWLIERMQRLQEPNQCRSLRRTKVLAIRRHVAAALQHLPNQLVLRETRCDKIQGRSTLSTDPGNRMAVAALLRLKDDSALSFEQPQLRQHTQIARAEIRPTVRDAAHPIELTVRIEKPIRINEKIGNCFTRTFLVDRAQHLELKRIVENRISEKSSTGIGVPRRLIT